MCKIRFLNNLNRHSEWRKLAKKLRRKRIRQAAARAKHEKAEADRQRREQSPSYEELVRKQEVDEEFQIQEEKRLGEEAERNWLRVEKEARKQWQELQKKLQEAREERARQNELIRVEWEREQRKLKELKEAKEKEREELEGRLRRQQEELEDFIVNGGETPEHLKVIYEINPNKPICPFFQKTASCRFRDACSRNHVKPGVSRVLLIPNFYSHYSLEQSGIEHGDSSLEYECEETYSHFKEFFFDVLPEMEQCGKVRQFRVCCNHEPHLRGNVYVEYSTTREAVKSFQIFNGRWYGGKQLSVEFCRIDSWRSAICGLYVKGSCPKGNACNFLHVFRNPHNLFHRADRDEHRTPPQRSQRNGSERRHWRWSESPERMSLDDLEPREKGLKSEKKRERSRSIRKHSRSRSRSRSEKERKSSSNSSRRKTRHRH